jgi:predicted house-cleaning noncanonical NTP pyrophosphatase (MazG superfamily)
MQKKIYNKLIRDKIPEIIRADNEEPKVKILNQKDYMIALKQKISEEAIELIEAKNKDDVLNELVDLQELIDSTAKAYKIRKSTLISAQKGKNKKRGGFKKRLFLIETKVLDKK